MQNRPVVLCFVILSVILLTSCATVSREEAATADFGPYPANYEEQVKHFFNQTLKDPYSAVYRIGTPRKGVATKGLIFGGGKVYGWIMPVGVNAKNSFGGYVGERTCYILLAGGRLYDVTNSFSSGQAAFAP